MLWNIVGTPHQVLGSIRATSQKGVTPTWVDAALIGKKRIVFESDSKDQGILKIGVDPKRAHLKHPDTAHVYAQVKSKFGDIKFGDFGLLKALKPWRAALHVQSVFMALYGIKQELGVQHILRKRATVAKLKIEYLEEASRAFEIFENCGEPHNCVRFFADVLKSPGNEIREGFATKNAWLRSDLLALEAILREKVRKYPLIFKPLIFGRNAEWAQKAADLARDDRPALFVVDSLHLVGKQSFLAHMAEHGFVSTPVPVKRRTARPPKLKNLKAFFEKLPLSILKELVTIEDITYDHYNEHEMQIRIDTVDGQLSFRKSKLEIFWSRSTKAIQPTSKISSAEFTGMEKEIRSFDKSLDSLDDHDQAEWNRLTEINGATKIAQVRHLIQSVLKTRVMFHLAAKPSAKQR